MNSKHTLLPDTLIRPVVFLALGTTTLLMVPLVAMQFTAEVNWTYSDFVFAGILLFGTGLSYILVTRIFATRFGRSMIYRMAVGFALLTGLFMIWSNLAVGIIGPENNAYNLIYFGVIAVGIIGAFIARFKPKGMIYTMFGMACATAIIIGIALITGMQNVPGSSILEIIAVNGFFIFLFTLSALMFRFVAIEELSV
jgi:hypothetical protein